jgi:hypothetical protein
MRSGANTIPIKNIPLFETSYKNENKYSTMILHRGTPFSRTSELSEEKSLILEIPICSKL